jgi:hypothetical protein
MGKRRGKRKLQPALSRRLAEGRLLSYNQQKSARISEGFLPRVPLAVQKTISSFAAFIASVTGVEKGLARYTGKAFTASRHLLSPWDYFSFAENQSPANSYFSCTEVLAYDSVGYEMGGPEVLAP